MKKSLVRIIIVFSALAMCVVSCSKKEVNFEKSGYCNVEEISTEVLGRLSPIIIRLKTPFVQPLSKETIAPAVNITPAINGEWTCPDERTLTFTPSEPYKGGEDVCISIDTGMLNGQASGVEGFVHTFKVAKASFDCIPIGLDVTENSDNNSYIFTGSLETDIAVSKTVIEKTIEAKVENARKSTRQHIQFSATDTPTIWNFAVPNIERDSEDGRFILSWDGTKVGAAGCSGSRTWLVPRNGSFSVLEVALLSSSELQVRFSDAVDSSQDMRGLIRAVASDGSAVMPVRYAVNANLVSVYSNDDWTSDVQVTVENGIKNSTGSVLEIPVTTVVAYRWQTPSVKFASASGVILPTTQGVIIPIETVNLKGVIVKAYRIYADTILQFLQVNELDGNNEMSRVAEPLWTKSFDFEWDDSMKNRVVPRGLDLSELIKKYPDGMIQLAVTFRYRHIMYECLASHEDFSALTMPADDYDPNYDESSYWNYWDDDYYTYRKYRTDPCHPAFYLQNFNHEIIAKRNLLISDIGLTAKKDVTGTWYATVTDMKTAEPLPGATVTLYSFAQQPVTSAITDALGRVTFTSPVSPAFITASKNNQTSYLKIGYGTGLNVSHFEIDGEKPDKGVKGFIYGERGVWRPGDEIHLVFILQNEQHDLPMHYPITFELHNPKGTVTVRRAVTESIDGFYRIDTQTPIDGPTGTWTAFIKAGNRSWSKSLKIETIIPNRLSIDLQCNTKTLTYGNNTFTLKGAWLHGAPSPGLAADITASYQPAITTFSDYSDYVFTNPERVAAISEEKIWEGVLDNNSQATMELDFSPDKTFPGKMRLNLMTRLYENEGTCSIEQSLWEFSPYDRYVGLKLPKGDADRGMLLTDITHTADVVVVTPEGKPVVDDIEIEYTVYKLDWKWWWEKDALTNASYISNRSVVKNGEGIVTTKNGKASFPLRIDSPEWGRYLVVAHDRLGGHEAACIVYIDWPGCVSRSQEDDSGSAAMLTITKDKTSYVSNETAVISFPSADNGTALITVEKSGVVVAQDIVRTKKGTTVYHVPLTPSMAPNIYVHVSLLQPHMQTQNSLPIRLYGVVPVKVLNPLTKIQPVITMNETLAPVKDAVISVKEHNGKPMTFTLAVVDEGLLGLTRFSPTNPWDFFYRKESSLLESWDIYKYVMSAYGGKLETLLSVGGSDIIIPKNGDKPNRFKPVVKFFGPFTLEAGESKDVTFIMPQYIGAVRAMVIAGHNGAYGIAEKTAKVACDVMLLPAAPRTFGTNETIDLPVTVFNGRSDRKALNVTFTSSGAVTANETKIVHSKGMDESVVHFAVKTSKPGWSKMTFEVNDGNGATNTVDLDIETVCRGSPVVETKLLTIEPGKTVLASIPSLGENGTNKLFVELSIMPVLDLTNRLEYLMQYPHGCLEQITSGGFPQLYLHHFMHLTAEQIENTKKNIESVFTRYPQYQTLSGGFAYWPGESNVNMWGTCYAGHFMTEAKRVGYQVPEQIYNAWLSFQTEAARIWTPADGNGNAVQAYRLYTLALAGKTDIASMNRLKTSKMDAQTEWLLAAAFALSGNRAAADDLIKNNPSNVSGQRTMDGTWSSPLRDKALMVHALSLLDESRMILAAKSLVDDFASDMWYSTQESAWTFMALAPYYEKNTSSKTCTFAIETDAAKEIGKVTKIYQGTFECSNSPMQGLSITNTGKTTLFGKATVRGLLSPGKEKAVTTKIGLNISYTDPTGQPIVDPGLLQPGEGFVMHAQIKNKSVYDLKNMVLTIPVPTHWEFTNHRMSSISNGSAPLGSTYQDFRDAVLYTYFNLDNRSNVEFVFDGYVAFKGQCAIPACSVEAMYDSEFSAVTLGTAADNR